MKLVKKELRKQTQKKDVQKAIELRENKKDSKEAWRMKKEVSKLPVALQEKRQKKVVCVEELEKEMHCVEPNCNSCPHIVIEKKDVVVFLSAKKQELKIKICKEASFNKPYCQTFNRKSKYKCSFCKVVDEVFKEAEG